MLSLVPRGVCTASHSCADARARRSYRQLCYWQNTARRILFSPSDYKHGDEVSNAVAELVLREHFAQRLPLNRLTLLRRRCATALIAVARASARFIARSPSYQRIDQQPGHRRRRDDGGLGNFLHLPQQHDAHRHE